MKKNRGFTLVELIVVLVILAILAAILVPALLGWIDKANSQKDIEKAKAAMTAAQAVFTEAYGKDMPVKNNNVLGLPANCKVYSEDNNYRDINCKGTYIEQQVHNYVDDDPYIFLVAAGNSKEGSNSTKHQQYTILYAVYVAEKDSRPYYYYDGQWTYENATNVNMIIKDKTAKSNRLVYNGKEVDIQYYIICNKEKSDLKSISESKTSFWGYLRIVLPKKYGGEVYKP